jgi:hypothetical protein
MTFAIIIFDPLKKLLDTRFNKQRGDKREKKNEKMKKKNTLKTH